MKSLNADKYLKTVSSPNITLEEEKELFLIIKGDDSTEAEKDNAIERICRSHIRFISQMANYYCKRCSVEMEDMIGVGVVGMMTAIEKFNIDKKCKFTTYCGWWVKLEMIRHIQNSCPVKIPQSIHDGLIKIQNAMREAEDDLTRSEVKDKFNFSEDKMKKLEGAKYINTISFQKKYKDNNSEQISLFEDLIPDDRPTPYDSYEKEDLLIYMRDLLSQLDEKTYEIVMSKHEDKKVCLKDLADKYNVSIEMIRLIRVKATNDLRKKIFKKDEVKS